MHPREGVGLGVERHGVEQVARWCAVLLADEVPFDDPGLPSLALIGGGGHGEEQAARLVAAGQDYWLRTWGARGLLYAWHDTATPAVVAALADPHWRVREMAAKVVATHEVAEAAESLLPLVDDGTPRVRAAAVRALGLVGEGEALDVVRHALDDADPLVHRAAELALRRLQQRLDRW